MRSMLVVMTVVGVLLAFAICVPTIASLILHTVALSMCGGVLSSAVTHDWDRSRIAGYGAVSAIGFWVFLGRDDVQLRVMDAYADWLFETTNWTPLGYSIDAGVEPVTIVFICVVGGFVALRSAPHWHRWATSEAPREK